MRNHIIDLDCCSEMSNSSIYIVITVGAWYISHVHVCVRVSAVQKKWIMCLYEPPDLSSKRESFVHWWLSDRPGNSSSFPLPLSVTGTDKTLDVPSNISGNESLKHDPAAPTSPAPRQKRLTNLADTVHLTDDGGKSEMEEWEGKDKDAGGRGDSGGRWQSEEEKKGCI